MSHKIQITVDDELNDAIKAGAKQTGLSVSSYARLALKRLLTKQKQPLIDQAIQDIQSNQIDSLTLSEFNRQIDRL